MTTPEYVIDITPADEPSADAPDSQTDGGSQTPAEGAVPENPHMTHMINVTPLFFGEESEKRAAAEKLLKNPNFKGTPQRIQLAATGGLFYTYSPNPPEMKFGISSEEIAVPIFNQSGIGFQLSRKVWDDPDQILLFFDSQADERTLVRGVIRPASVKGIRGIYLDIHGEHDHPQLDITIRVKEIPETLWDEVHYHEKQYRENDYLLPTEKERLRVRALEGRITWSSSRLNLKIISDEYKPEDPLNIIENRLGLEAKKFYQKYQGVFVRLFPKMTVEGLKLWMSPYQVDDRRRIHFLVNRRDDDFVFWYFKMRAQRSRGRPPIEIEKFLDIDHAMDIRFENTENVLHVTLTHSQYQEWQFPLAGVTRSTPAVHHLPGGLHSRPA